VVAVPALVRRPAAALSIYGQISGHLIHAREVALAHKAGNLFERLAIDSVVLQIDALIVVVRKLHHQEHI
jgi:hypothetical protein